MYGKNKLVDKILYYSIGFLPLIIALFVYPNIPDQIPSHYSTIGEVARLESKGKVLIIPFLLAVFTYTKPKFFKNDFKTYKENRISDFSTLLFIISVNLLSYVELYTALNGIDISTRFNFYNLISCIICIVSMFLGSIFSDCDRDHTVSIKIPNYLMDDTVWKNLHHNLGSYWMSSGIVFLPIGILCGNIYISYLLIIEIALMIISPLFVILYYMIKYKKR